VLAEKTSIILFDGREASDDTVGLGQFLASLNQFLRKRPDVLVCWPTTDNEWHRTIRNKATQIGGENFCPTESDYEVRGPDKSDWPKILERMLLQFMKTFEDVGMGAQLIDDFANSSKTVGDFLTKASVAISDRVAKKQKLNKLPHLLFVITSSGDVVGEANRIRRAGKQILAPEPLLAHSPRSEAGKWWAERNKDPNHHLGYIISLFNATLITVSASAVVHACVLHGEDDLKNVALNEKAQPNSGSALQAVKASELYRFLSDSAVTEFTSGKKGRVQDTTIAAYAAIQALSAKRHKAINQAICALVRNHVPNLVCDPLFDFEVAHGGNLITDAMLAVDTRHYSTEFHHLSSKQCKAASMSSYIMDKLRNYAIHHQIIPR
jgi:hypothetical protein